MLFPDFPWSMRPRRSSRWRGCRNSSGARVSTSSARLAPGANKTRKREFLIGKALKLGATTVVSAGGLQSNHVRQTAAAAAKAGLACHLVLDRNVPIDEPAYRNSGNFLLDGLLGAVTHICA